MSFVFITTGLIIVNVTLVLNSVVWCVPTPFIPSQSLLQQAGIGTGIGMDTEPDTASESKFDEETSSPRQPRAIGSSSSSSGCFLTGCVPYSFTVESHGCGEGSVYTGQTKCVDGFVYECCPAPVRPPMALFSPADKDQNENGKPVNGKWSLYKMKETAHKILCMLGNVNEVFC